MAHKKLFTIPFRRKKQGKTNYKKRLALLKSGKLRLVVRKSNKHMLAQIVKYGDKGDEVLKSVTSKDLLKFLNINAFAEQFSFLIAFCKGRKCEKSAETTYIVSFNFKDLIFSNCVLKISLP